MTTRDYLLFSWLAYIDLPPLYVTFIQRSGSVPVAAFADAVLRMDAAGALGCVSLNDAAREAARELTGSEAVITGYINNNDTDGFVAYIIRSGCEIIVAMRGSETAGECVPTDIDWADNFCEPFSDSIQRESIEAVIRTLPDENVTFTGHSKGGHNALYALALSDSPSYRAVAFNAQGFAETALTDVQKAVLKDRGVNYVVSGDVIGALLYHPERREYVMQAPDTNAHMPEAFTFGEDGEALPALRGYKSMAVEGVTRAVDKSISGNTRQGLRGICHAVLRRAISARN